MLAALALLIGVARVLGELARYFHQPSLLGELLAGVLLGPTVFGSIAPEWQTWLFPATGPNALVLDGIATLSIVLFLLVAGMEVDLSIVWKQGRSALKVGVLGTAIPFAFAFVVAMLIPKALGWEGKSDRWVFVLFIATAMAITALPVIAKTLMDLDLYRTDLGMVVVSAAIFNDLISWTVFALILGMIGREGHGLGIGATLALTLVFAVVMLTLGRMLMHKLLPVLQAYTHYPGGVLGFAMTMGLAGAALTELIGIHAIFGAFLVGVALGDSTHLQERTRVMIDEFVSFIFTPVFFASIGLKVNFFTHFDLGLSLLVLALGCTGKLAGALLGAKWGRFAKRDQWAIAFAMNAHGAMEIVLGTLALQAGVINERLFVALVLMAIVTSAMSGPLIRRALQRRKPHQVIDHLSQKLCIADLRAETRQQAIQELATAAGESSGLDPAVIFNVAWEREQLVATGIGHGVAIPHARMPGLKKPVVALGISEAGIDFDAPDGQPAQVVFLLVTPESDPTAQIELSANISHLFRDPRCLEKVLRAKNFTERLAALKLVGVK